jgi:Mn2+/Fe2+ NRAMP family transporter
VGVSFGVKPVFVMMLSQACLSVVLPLTIASVFYLTSSKKLMNKHINKFFDFILLSLIMLFSLYVSYLGIRGLFVDLLNI